MRFVQVLFLTLFAIQQCLSQVPSVSVKVPSSAKVQSQFNITATFDNVASNSDAVGFSPFVDLLLQSGVVSAVGAVSWTDLTLQSYVYKFTANAQCVLHPYLFRDLTPAGPPAPNNVAAPNRLGFVCGNQNDTFVSILLPFSSFGPDAPPAVLQIPVTVVATLSSGSVFANAGFANGNRALIDSIANPPIVGGNGVLAPTSWVANGQITLAQVVVDLTTDMSSLIGWGWSNAFNYTVLFDVANSVTFVNGTMDLALSPMVAIGGLYVVDPVDGVTKRICYPTTQSLLPPSCVNFTTVCGGCIKSIAGPTPCYQPSCTGGLGTVGGDTLRCTFNNITAPLKWFITGVPIGYDRNGTPFDDPLSSANVTSTSALSVNGTAFNATSQGTSSGQSLTMIKSTSVVRVQLALNKAASKLVGGTQYVPGATVQYTLTVGVAPNHAYGKIIITDQIRDGLEWNPAQAPYMRLGGRTIPIDLARVSVDRSRIGNDGVATDGTDGITQLSFNVTDLLLASDGTTTKLADQSLDLVYFATIRSTFTDHSRSPADASVVAGDCLDNGADLSTTQVSLVDSTEYGALTRSASSRISVPTGSFSAALYAVNGALCSVAANAALCSQIEYDSLTTLTVDVTYLMATDSFYRLSMSEAFPVPLFDISALTWPAFASGSDVDVADTRNRCVGSAVPALGRMCFSSRHLYTRRNPTFSVNTASMTWSLDWGTSSFSKTTSAISVLATVSLTGVPWIDGFDVVTLEDKRENANSACTSTPLAHMLFRTRTPKLCTSQGAVVSRAFVGGAVTSLDARFTSFSTTGTPFSGTVTQAATGGSGTPSIVGSATLTNVQAGDQLRMAMIVVSQGRGAAYDVQVRLPLSSDAGFAFADPTNVRVFFGNGTAAAAATYASATGVVSVPALAGASTRAGTDATGANVLVIVYDVTVQAAFPLTEATSPLRALNATLINYGALPSTTNYVTSLHAKGQYPASCLTTSVALSSARPTMTFDFASGDSCTLDSSRDIAPGEEFRLRANITLPYGTLPNANVSMSLSTTAKPVTLLNMTVVANPASSSKGASAGTTLAGVPLTGSPPATGVISFGSLSLSPTATSNVLVVEAWWRTDNATTISNALALTFNEALDYDVMFASPAATVRVLQAPVVTVRRQSVTITGGTNSSVVRPFDEGDVIRYCFNITRVLATACAYNTVVTVPIPSVLQPLAAPIVLWRTNSSAVSTAVVTGGVGSSTLTATIPTIDKAAGSIAVCYDALFQPSFTGVRVRTTATVCSSTTPLSTGALTCNTVNVDVTPQASATLATTTSDTCTDNSQRVAHVGELITATVNATIPAGATNPLLVDVTWSTAVQAVAVSSRIVSYGSCITTRPFAVGTAANVSSALLRWSFGNMARTTEETAGCDTIVLEAVLRVANVSQNTHLSTLTVGASATGGGSTATPASQTYSVLLPTLTSATTLTPTIGDALDTARFCVSFTNSETNTARATCAYNVAMTTAVPAGYQSNTTSPLVASFASIAPGVTTTPVCYDLTLQSSVLTSQCNLLAATTTYESDPAFSTRGSVSSTQTHCAATPSVTASISATDDACTTVGRVDRTVTGVHAGETITYQIVVRLPEGVATVLTPQIQFDARTTLVASSAVVARVGNSVSAPTPTLTATTSGVTWAFGQVTNTANNIVDTQDEIVLQVTVRVVTTATNAARFAPVVTVTHRGTPVLTAANASVIAEVLEPVLLRASTATPSSGGAYGDTTQFAFTLTHGATSSGCAENVQVCENVPVDMDFGSSTVQVSGVTPPPALAATPTGFCLTLPKLASGVSLSVTYNSVFRDLPAGLDRCANGNVTYLTAGLISRSAVSSVCARQQVLETVGDLVWLDGDGNGQQDSVGLVGGETPIVGALVRLRLTSTNALVATTTTNATGVYLFDRRQHGLQPSVAYTIELDARSGLHATLADRVADSIDNDGVASGAVVVARSISVAARTQNLTIDFGFAQPIVLGDFVWRDLNADGLQNDGAASALADLIVQLRLANGTVIATTSTTATGSYSFSSLNVSALVPGGAYQIVVPLDSQPLLRTRVGGRDTFLVPTRLGGGGATLDNNAVLDAGKTLAVVSFSTPNRWNVIDLTLDIGLVPPPPLGVRVGDRVFFDANANGLQDAEDLSIAGLTLQMLDQNSVLLASTVTNATGYYSFAFVVTQEPQAIYLIVVPNGQSQLIGRAPAARDVGTNDAIDSDATRDVDTGLIFLTFVAPIDGQTDFSLDIGLRSPAATAAVKVTDASLPMCLLATKPCQSATLFDGTVCAYNDVCTNQYRLTTIDLLKTEAPISLEQGRVVGTNALEIVVQHPAVADRIVERIVLDENNPACNYPGPYWCKGVQTSWSKTASGAPLCRDIYVSNIPWTANCTLQRSENATHVAFRGVGTVYYNDTLGKLDNIDLGARKVASVIQFALYQPKVIRDIATTVRIIDEPRLLGALTRQLFDYTTGNATLTVTLSMAAPLRTTAVATLTTPSGVAMTQIGAVDNTRCGNNKDASCQQTYTFTIDPRARCDLDGEYQMTYGVACHPSVANTPDCPIGMTLTPLAINVTLDTEDFCAVVQGLLQVNGSMTSHGEFATTPAYAFGPLKTAFFQDQPLHFQVLANSLNGFPFASSRIATVEMVDKQKVRRVVYNVTSGGAVAGWSFTFDSDPNNALGSALTHRHHISYIAAPARFGDVERNLPIDSNVIVGVEVAFRNPIGPGSVNLQRKRIMVEKRQAADNARSFDAAAVVRIEAPVPLTTAPSEPATTVADAVPTTVNSGARSINACWTILAALMLMQVSNFM